MSQRPVLVLDTASLYYRSFYALPDSMKSPDGQPHQAIRGFLTMLDAFHQRFDPSTIVACWDVDWRPKWRVDLLPSYKTHRVLESTDEGDFLEDEPDTLGPQIQAIAEILDSSSIERVGIDHYEADDVAATLAYSIPGPVIVISGDRDMVQVVDDSQEIRLFLAVNGGMPAWPLLDEQSVIERYGVSSRNYVDFAIMRGDPSDGIPGVPGIGEKTAAALISAFGDLQGIITAAHGEPVKPLTPRIASLLREHAHQLEVSKRVATAVRTLPIAIETDRTSTTRSIEVLQAIAKAWGVERFIPQWM